ncbi:hypothetical protein CsSME_00037663 [Camellia sinensis var. sinensis]
MDEYSGKRAVGGLVIPRKGSGLVSRDTAESRDKDAEFCNRLGCNGRLNHTRSTQNGSEKFKSSRPSFHASTGKQINGSSTRTCSMVTNTRKFLQESRKKISSQLETDSCETSSSSVQDEPEVLELDNAESSKVRLMEVGSSSIASNSKPRNVFRQKSVLGTRDTLLGSSVPLACKSTSQGARNGLRNLRCNSISDVVPSGGSSSESNLNRRKDMVKKRNPEVESSSSGRGKKMSGPLSEDSRSSTSSNGISISDSRRTRNWPPGGNNGVGSVRTRRSINGNTRTRVCNQGNGNSLAPMELCIGTSQVAPPETSIGLDVPSSSRQFSAEASLSHSTSCRSPIGPSELGITRSLISHDGFQRYNMDGIAEVLLALERIEQDEELTYEQLLALETNLFLGGLGFYDQHRDMRLDIDNMSYEELLALEEKMGTVSTALSEEALLKCLKRSIYQPTSPAEGAMRRSGDEDIKCSICQEEYGIGDEVGRLKCEHGYHMVCIEQWLQLKNWCPICKASAVSSRSSSSPPL